MLTFCAPGLPGFSQMQTSTTICDKGAGHMFHTTPKLKSSTLPTRTGTSSTPPDKHCSKVLMSLKGLSYAAAAIVLSVIPNVNLPNVPHLLQPAQASETDHINSAPLRFSQSFTLEEGSPIKLDPHWDVHSLESKTETFVMFSNDSNQVVDIWWIDYYGREVYYASIRPGSSYMQPSYATHPWVVRDHISQNPLLVLVAKDNPALAIVNNTI